MTRFKIDDLLRAVATAEAAEEKQQRVNALLALAQEHGTPLVEDHTRATFLFCGAVQKVGIIGDMTNWCNTEDFRRIPGTDLFYWQAEFPPDARLEYNLVIDDSEELHIDPLNPFLSLNGLGPLSELAMPGYRYHPLFRDFRNGRKGNFAGIETHKLPAGCLGYPHEIHVYLPPDYPGDGQRYPAVYFQDGADYIEFAQVPHVLNHLIREGTIPPLLAVFEAPPNRHLPAAPNRMTQYGMNDDYVRFFTEELVPFIDTHYPTRTGPSHRLVVGDSYGGLISAYIGFSRPEVFGMVYSQSGYMSFQNDRLIRAFREHERRPLRLYVDVGHYERCVGAAFLPAAEVDFLAANRRFREVLAEKGYDFIYREYPEGHTWGNWRRHLIDGLIHFFGATS